MGKAAMFDSLRELASVLGGAVGGSRVAVHLGWIDADLQVGQTGHRVSPRLYIACGISGSYQHRIGMTDSEIIVAINNDREAPVFETAHFGIVGDLKQVVPVLTKRLRNGPF